MAEVSGDLGINYRMLGNWVRAELPIPAFSYTQSGVFVHPELRR